jgi:hypothetical protein
MSAENQESGEYPVDAIHYYPKDKRLVIEVEGGVSFALRQAPEGLMAQLLLNEVANQRAAALRDDVVPASEASPLLDDSPSHQVEHPSLVTVPAASATDAQPGAPQAEAASATTSAAERDPAKGEQRQFTGRLKADPKEGRPDSNGLPTAWAPLAAHQDGSDEALMLSASFHKATRRIALGLHAGDQITVRGFHYTNPDPQRMASLRVFMFIHYPGKPPK